MADVGQLVSAGLDYTVLITYKFILFRKTNSATWVTCLQHEERDHSTTMLDEIHTHNHLKHRLNNTVYEQQPSICKQPN